MGVKGPIGSRFAVWALAVQTFAVQTFSIGHLPFGHFPFGHLEPNFMTAPLTLVRPMCHGDWLEGAEGPRQSGANTRSPPQG